MFSALGRNNVNVKAIAQGASERNITVIDSTNTKQALNIFEAFEEDIKQINLFVTGVGNVGSKLIDQLNSQRIPPKPIETEYQSIWNFKFEKNADRRKWYRLK